VIGGGVNGLVAAALLARAKKSVIVLEQRDEPGGAAVTMDLAPGFRVPALAHSIGPLAAEVVRALRLDKIKTLELLRPEPSLAAIGQGAALVFHRDDVLTAASINALSTTDAGRWQEFVKVTERLSSVLARLDRTRPPSIDGDRASDRWQLLQLARATRKLERVDLTRLVRWMPMSIADIVSDWFESDLLRAAIAAHAIAGNPVGPRSAGTGAMWLQRLAADPSPAGSGVTVRGGPGALTAALVQAATAAGAEIRTNAQVTRAVTRDGRVTGVVLANGDELAARVVLGAVPVKMLLSRLLTPEDVPPTVRERARNIRARGVTAKINLALSALPQFTGVSDDPGAPAARILIAPDLDYLERAFDATKYGRMSDLPWLEAAIPSVRDDSLAPSGAHVMSLAVHFAPRELREGAWADSRETLWQRAMGVLEQWAPGVSALVVARQIITPEDLEQGWGNPGGHIYHGETTLDQFWASRPLLGWAQYQTPVTGLFLGSAGTHPGGGLTGLPGWHASRAVLRFLR
jgi:phytoene dehydrogenase-like protein